MQEQKHELQKHELSPTQIMKFEQRQRLLFDIIESAEKPLSSIANLPSATFEVQQLATIIIRSLVEIKEIERLKLQNAAR